MAAVRAMREPIERQTRAFLERLTDADAAREYVMAIPNGGEFRMLLWRMLLHVANHGTQHRSEVAAQLTAFGRSPGDLDLLVFFNTVA